MCLHVNKNVHPGRKRRIATRPLVVHKDLISRWSDRWPNTEWVSPYHRHTQNSTWRIGVANKETLTKGGHLLGGCPTIYKGLHSALPRRKRLGYTKRLWAVIPAGARFYVGLNKDIVSDQLIVFDTKKAMLSYLGVKSLAPPIKAFNANEYSVLEQ